MAFDDLDDIAEAATVPTKGGKRAEITAAQFHALAARQLPCGIFCLMLTDGSRKRFRVRLERGSFCTGQRTLSRYCKIDDGTHGNEWETIGVVEPTGFNLFKRWRNEWESRWAAAIWALVNKLDAPGYSLEIELRCWLTGRKLKPEDAACGLCPTWQKKFGISR